jgi:GDP-L-fucose synthase
LSSWLAAKRVVVTGGAGFLGGHVVSKLEQRGCKSIFVPRSNKYDLVKMQAVKRLYKEAKPHIVIHLAARVGGIGANMNNPGSFFL